LQWALMRQWMLRHKNIIWIEIFRRYMFSLHFNGCWTYWECACPIYISPEVQTNKLQNIRSVVSHVRYVQLWNVLFCNTNIFFLII
jgi:hypothetical protein